MTEHKERNFSVILRDMADEEDAINALGKSVKDEWVSQATDAMDYAVRKLGGAASLKEWEQEAQRAVDAGLFPSKKESEIALKAGIDNESRKKRLP